jgi:hypothetical protein
LWFFVRGYFTTSNNWNRFFAYFTSKNSYHPIKQGLSLFLGVKNWGYSKCWRMDMKCQIPKGDTLTHRAYFTQSTNNTGDAAIFNFSGLRVGGGANWPGYTENEVTSRGTWHTLSLISDGKRTSAWINGAWVLDAKSGQLSGLDASGYIGISGDNKDEDGLMLIDDIKTYVLRDAMAVPIPLDAGSVLATGEKFESPFANTSRYAVRGVRPSASEPG